MEKYIGFDLDNNNVWRSWVAESNGEGIVIWNIDSKGIYFCEPSVYMKNQGGSYDDMVIDYIEPNQFVCRCIGLQDKHGKELHPNAVVQLSYKNIIDSPSFLTVIEYDHNFSYIFRDIDTGEHLEYFDIANMTLEKIGVLGFDYNE